MIWVRIRYLPADSALVGELTNGPSWSRTEHLLDDIRAALTDGKPHPARPQPKPTLNPARIAAGQRRRAARKRRIEAGEIT